MYYIEVTKPNSEYTDIVKGTCGCICYYPTQVSASNAMAVFMKRASEFQYEVKKVALDAYSYNLLAYNAG